MHKYKVGDPITIQTTVIALDNDGNPHIALEGILVRVDDELLCEENV